MWGATADFGFRLAGHDGAAWSGHFLADLVAANRGEVDGLDDVNCIDDPADLRFPVDGFEDAAGGGGGDDVIGDALGFHLRAGEAGEVAPDVKFDSVRHGGLGFQFGKVADVGETFEVVVLSPESGVVGEGDGVDQRIGEREFVFDGEIGSGNGDGFVDWNDQGSEEGTGDGLCLSFTPFPKGDFADLCDDDGRDDDVRVFCKDGAEMLYVWSVIEAFQPG